MKKYFNIKLLTAFASIMIMVTANNCTSLTDGYSTDPVNITDPGVITVSKYLSGIEVSLIGALEGDVARIAGLWSNNFSGDDRQYVGIANYSVSGQVFDQEWGTIYAGIFENTKLIRRNSKPLNNFVSIGIAQIVDGLCLGLAADLWGDVPYSEARGFPTNPSPTFDSQSAVYTSAFALLDSGIVNMGKSGTTDGDFLYDGDKTKWIKLAHTLKARLYLHNKNYTNAISEGLLGLSSAGDNLMASHGEAYQQTFNIYYSFLSYDRTGYMNANSFAPKLIDPSLSTSRNNAKTNEDARFNYLFYPGGGLNVNSAEYELNVQCDFDGWGVTADYNGFFGGTTSFPLVTWQENALTMAEAYMKQGTPDAVSALATLNKLRAFYNTGGHVNSGYATSGLSGTIDASTSSTAVVGDSKTKFTKELKVNSQLLDADGNYIGTVASITDDKNLTLMTNSSTDLTSGGKGNYFLDNAVYDAYFYSDFAPGGIENADNINQDQALLREILEERYVTMIGQIGEFTDMRRTHNFLNIPLPPGKTDFPKRFYYSQIEINTNPNTPKDVDLFTNLTSFTSAY